MRKKKLNVPCCVGSGRSTLTIPPRSLLQMAKEHSDAQERHDIQGRRMMNVVSSSCGADAATEPPLVIHDEVVSLLRHTEGEKKRVHFHRLFRQDTLWTRK